MLHGILISRYVFKNPFKNEKQRPAFSDMWKNVLLPLILVRSQIKNYARFETHAEIREKEFRLSTIHWYIVSV